ncbi:MAG: hypothetical protein RL011_2524 [Pseudomonadota bacterium]
MAMHTPNKYWRLLLILGLTVGGSAACSSSKPDEEGLVPSTEADAEGAGAPSAEGDVQATASAESKDTAAQATAEAPTAEAASPSEGSAAAAPTEGPSMAPASAAPQSMAVTSPGGQGRVVRHVKVKQATLRSGPSAKAESVGQLTRGERIIVDVENGWGRIADGLYIKLSDTAPKPVAVKRQRAEWMPPAH